MINTEICTKISKAAVKALLYEVNVSPKPGLVDRFNTGAHKDMDIFTFIESALALEGYFYDCCRITLENHELDFPDLFRLLKKRGIAADGEMFRATSGVNTHKGAIFSLGLMSSAAAMAHVNDSDFSYVNICKYAGLLSESLVKRDLDEKKAAEMTHGREIYNRYHISGIRGEAEAGFPTIRDHSYPFLLNLLKDGMTLNDASVNVLMKIIMNTDDTNLISRGGLDGLEFAKFSAGNVLRAGGMSTEEGIKEVQEMDRTFIKRNLSPGGSADLLAVTLMIHFINNG
ncbi:triphosphoribosyl-dephospho-CoA synthase [Dethiosulfatibacter aminovorans DSM 17477]|uniref:Probable 2-(5''-triphosphoribosyl)-3'-dephosphocoenzyme-A synthase n=1 Tax=Dethiosulfatibacter aminovorans DSM 17477 TaxID=1121476 RepID=A0A1M6E6Q3_9FIRM|nr:triphosphoribosyl-dephospho-CoA synthase CitG [Dethiosulfatibacter aminovorans]SHI81177.1 triphosphoribosyl-dephospho-CoA synthase [Dethiosulfatibacter aminovorans DSM 17477]